MKEYHSNQNLKLLFKRFVYAFIVDRTVFGENKIKP